MGSVQWCRYGYRQWPSLDTRRNDEDRDLDRLSCSFGCWSRRGHANGKPPNTLYEAQLFTPIGHGSDAILTPARSNPSLSCLPNLCPKSQRLHHHHHREHNLHAITAIEAGSLRALDTTAKRTHSGWQCGGGEEPAACG